MNKNSKIIYLKEVNFYYNVEVLKLKDFSDEEYIELTNLKFYLIEMTKMFIKKKNHLQFDKFIEEFLQIYLKGEYTLLKQYSFLNSSFLNRISFAINFGKIFDFDKKLTGFDIIQYIKLICGDFPHQIIFESLERIREENFNEEKKELLKIEYKGKLFLKSFFLIFVYYEFYIDCKKILEKNVSTENFSKKIYENFKKNTINFWKYSPPLNIIFKILLNYSPTGDINVQKVFTLFKPEMLDLIEGGKISLNNFIKDLIESNLFEKHIENCSKKFEINLDKVEGILNILNEKSEKKKKKF